MRKRAKALCLLLAVSLLLTTGGIPVRAANPAGSRYCNTYVNTGNQRQDILNIALGLTGYTELGRNDTIFGDWCGYPRQPWCAAFVSWCARKADISQDIVKQSPRARPTSFEVPYYPGTEYTPQPGDLFFTEGFTHTGLVWYVEGDFFYSIEGNAKYHDYQTPDDPEEDSYYVMSNKRLISSYYFGVPEYEGEGNHQYTKGWDTAHPHKEYYQCTDCGDKYYTGYQHIVSSCKSCMKCGCKNKGVGYYIVNNSAQEYPVKVRTSHSTTATHNGYVSAGEVVYVYGTSGSWAYVDYNGHRGHLLLRYLDPYYPAPETPQCSTDKTTYRVNEPVQVSWNIPQNTEAFRLLVLKNGVQYDNHYLGKEQGCTLAGLDDGDYQLQLVACNATGGSKVATVRFAVRDDCTVSYHSPVSCTLPQPQQGQIGQSMALSATVPQLGGYEFLEWATQQNETLARYAPGSEFTPEGDTQLYAVWRTASATAKELTIETMPGQTVHFKGDPLNTAGLALNLRYSDGSGCRVTEGYAYSGYDPEACGNQTVTVRYEGLETTFEVQVIDYIPGDIDGNRRVDRDDVVALLWHVTFPELYPLDAPADFVPNGKVDRDDLVQLLWHVTFPELFPLEQPTNG